MRHERAETMNRPSLARKSAIPIVTLLAAALLAGCASHYPYGGGSGVYYGKSHARHGYGYKPYYGHSSYRYDYNYYRYDYVSRSVPWWSGYGRYHHDYRRTHDRRDDHRHDRDSADRSGDAVRELRRVTDQQRRRALLRRDDATRGGSVRSHQSSRERPAVSSSRSSSGGARGQLRRHSSGGSDGGRSDRGRTKPAPRSSVPKNAPSEGGVRMPEKRRR